MHNTPTTNAVLMYGNQNSNGDKMWEIAQRNNLKPRVVRNRQVKSYKRVGLL